MDLGAALVHSVTADRAVLRDLAQAAEQLGYHSIWVSEHIAIPKEYTSVYPFAANGRPPFAEDGDWSEAMVTLGFLAGVTDRVRLGTSAIPMLCRDPLSLAKQAASVDRLSDGRLELGIGAGWCREEAELLGHPHDHPGARMVEAIEIMRLAWSQPSFSYSGRFWTIPEVYVNPKPVRGGELPIWIGGLSPAAVRATVAHGVGNLVIGGVDKVASAAETLRAERPEIRIWVMVARGPNAVEKAKALAAAGADLVTLICDARVPSDLTATFVDEAMRDLEEFAREARS
jgi:probable F420-dependent oxidoreductase